MEIPVFLSDGPVDVVVELQIRTIAQDFWASLEHKIFYKYEGEVPEHLVQELADAAAVATKLDMQMQRLHTEVHGHDANDQAGHEATFDTKAFQGLLSLAQQASTRGPEKCADN